MADDGSKTITIGGRKYSPKTVVGLPLGVLMAAGGWAGQTWEGHQEERLHAVEQAVQAIPVIQEAIGEMKNTNRRIETKLDALLLQRNVDNNRLPGMDRADDRAQPVTAERRRETFDPALETASGVRQ